jgi:clan AA aspartic protease
MALSAAGQLPPKKIRSTTVDAIVDMGAARSVVPKTVLDQIGIGPIAKDQAKYADGRVELVDVAPVHFDIFDRQTFDDAYIVGDEVLIGQTILEKLDLLADCSNGRLVPNPEHPDGPVLRI